MNYPHADALTAEQICEALCCSVRVSQAIVSSAPLFWVFDWFVDGFLAAFPSQDGPVRLRHLYVLTAWECPVDN